ncbi:arylamine N-acetyltransferase [Thalassospira sp.]|uniref:arylamine N-acetyltransferase family protein n=1 Tax=Thalassospira sp. TaxID=1912094 RepID=UPI002737601F|nr:arylamine N-acetyltransferase [Thalassospira sp.]MDP2697558.1 arylamine N-acetyltransferase [Thalassospira sp.]
MNNCLQIRPDTLPRHLPRHQSGAANAVDLDAYFARIGYDGPREASLETLRALLARHIATIPFEAMDVLCGVGVDLAPGAIDAKLITGQRGGYCFEQNGLFKRVLSALGFAVEGLAGRVMWMQPEDAPMPPRCHMALRVVIDGAAWLVDVGVGSTVPDAPLLIDTGMVQVTAFDRYRLRPVGDDLRLEMQIGTVWQPVYQFSPAPVPDIDYQVMNWYASTHDKSVFRHNLTASLTTPTARFSLQNNRLTVRPRHGAAERHFLTADELEQVLDDIFGLPVDPAWRAAIERVCEAAPDL